MTPDTTGNAGGQNSDRPRIDTAVKQDLERWAQQLDASPRQVKEAVDAVGDSAADVELHLKGSRSTTNRAQAERAGASDADSSDKPR